MATPPTDANPPRPDRKRKWGLLHDILVQPKSSHDYDDIDYHNEMRILKIYHGQKDEPLKASLITRPFPDGSVNQNYCALSYTWGSPDDPHDNEVWLFQNITGEGDAIKPSEHWNKYSTFYVRDNLAAALRALRHPTEDKLVWVDALCIHQENLIEKTAQVARMDDIYGSAKMVCIWLGEDRSEKAVETFEFLKGILYLQVLDRLVQDEESSEKWRLVVELMRNRWFGRRWIIQELALAKQAEVRWGDAHLDWPEFACAIELFLHKYWDVHNMLSEKPSKYEEMLSQGHHRSLDARALAATTLVKATNALFRKSADGIIQQRLLDIEVLVTSLFRPQEATDPKDTIYAVLSLAKDTARGGAEVVTSGTAEHVTSPDNFSSRSTPQRIENQVSRKRIDVRLEPDYSKDTAQLYSGFMEYCIEQSQSLDILCRHWASTTQQVSKNDQLKAQLMNKKSKIETKHSVPTWILPCEGHAFGAPHEIQSGRKNGNSLVGELHRDRQQTYNASGRLTPCVAFGKRQNLPPIYSGTLEVKGFECAQVVDRSPIVRDGFIPLEAFELSDQDWDWDSSDRENCLKRLPEQLWRTLVADRGANGSNAPLWYRLACRECFRTITFYGGAFNTKIFDDTLDTPRTTIEFIQRVQETVWNRRFFRAKSIVSENKYYFGFAPKTVDREDIVAILFGCSVPVILRKNQDNEQYTLIGECYTHGIMDGEAIREAGKNFSHPYENVRGFTLV